MYIINFDINDVIYYMDFIYFNFFNKWIIDVYILKFITLNNNATYFLEIEINI